MKTNNIIEHTVLFRLFAAVTGGDDEIAQGTYVVDSDMDYRALLNSLSSSSSNRKEVEVTITEGMTVQQIFQLLEEEGVSTVDKLNDMAANHDYAFSFLQDIPLGDPNRLEGYLFPDTYDFYMGEDARYVINKMLVNFDSRVNDDIRAQIEETGYSIREILTIASMIEKETDGTDRANIASVIYNRLNNPGASAGTNGYLQIDATLAYLNGARCPPRRTSPSTPPTIPICIPACPPAPSPTPAWNPSRPLWSRRAPPTIIIPWATTTSTISSTLTER